jgi:hypothetical protein
MSLIISMDRPIHVTLACAVLMQEMSASGIAILYLVANK